MTSTAGRWQQRLHMLLIATIIVAVCLALATSHVRAAAKKRKHAASHITQVSTKPTTLQDTIAEDNPSLDLGQEKTLSYSDEFDRAELIEHMLSECRGISYNAYELAQTSGEQLWLPAPIQLVVVRVRHPYCAELLRTYAPKSRV